MEMHGHVETQCIASLRRPTKTNLSIFDQTISFFINEKITIP